ncbi:hypothetical protein ACP70R_040140 [Stipagrostis hirtigluma subsp. patula]
MRPRPMPSSATRSRRPLADIPAANFFSLDVSASDRIEAELDYPAANSDALELPRDGGAAGAGVGARVVQGRDAVQEPHAAATQGADHEFSKTHSCLYDFEMDNLTDAVLRYCLFTAEILDFDEQDVVQQVQEFYADFCAIDPLPFHFEHSK